jgi:uncharacterized protein YjiK
VANPTRSYDFDAPTATFDLPASLQEVSGITVLPDGRLAAVQDEAGIIYTVDPQDGSVVSETPFAGPGDYEDVELAGGALWVLEANGTLYEIPQGGGAASEHDTPLKRKCDAEGLGLDPLNNRLLIACKEEPGDDLDEDEHRAVFGFDLQRRQMAAEPALLLERVSVDSDEDFKPSAVAVHPATGEAYVLSSVRRAIAVVDAAGRLVRVDDLPPSRNAQPEGLAFAPDGTLYLTNEGPDGPATLQVFAPAR